MILQFDQWLVLFHLLDPQNFSKVDSSVEILTKGSEFVDVPMAATLQVFRSSACSRWKATRGARMMVEHVGGYVSHRVFSRVICGIFYKV